ncbi:MAG: hypothetical protein RLZZ298_747 [Pseudomonadota bacterium]
MRKCHGGVVLVLATCPFPLHFLFNVIPARGDARREGEIMYPRIKPLAALLSLLPIYSVSAETQQLASLDPIVVTATRFGDAAPRINSNISVITQTDIEQSPARNIPDLLKTLAGVDVRPLYGSMGIDASVDIRGTGEAAGSNTLILLDGQRLNPVDMGSIKWETVPLSAVRQIEVLRGTGSVVYGDRASGGVINIITDKSDKPRANIRAEAGSFGYGSLDVSAAGGKDGWYGSLFGNTTHTDGYRRNSDADRASLSGRGARRFEQGELYVDFAGYQQDYGLPSALSKAQFEADPKQASTPNYRMTRDGYRLRPGGVWQVTQNLEFELDGSFAEDNMLSRNPDWLYRSKRQTQSQSLTPRLRWAHGLPGTASSETVFGYDYYNGKLTSDDLDYFTKSRLNRQTASVVSNGFYAQNTTAWKNGIDLTAGIRQQQFKEEVVDQGAALRDSLSHNLTAWELGGGYRLNEAMRAYVKVARNFRLPNSDELFAYDCSGWPCTTVFNGTLKAQTGHLREAGLVWQSAAWKEQLTVFQQDNENEIGYIGANGRNANLDPLRRRGIESETTWHPVQNWKIRLALNFTEAQFTSGIYDGKNIPLVPRHKETLAVTWDGARHGIHTALLQNVGDRYFGGDFNNTQTKLAGYTTLDYQVMWKFAPWALAVRATNLTNAKYSPVGYSGTYYPADPTSFFVSAKLDF